MEIRRDTLLGKAYNFWIWCDGKPRQPEDLCHFMRVCLFWWWMRWFFISGQFIPFKEDYNPGSDTPRGISPYWVVAISYCLLVVVCRTYVNPIPWLIGIGIVSLIIVAIITGALIKDNSHKIGIWTRQQKRKVTYDPLVEALSVFGQWMAAKKQRICPFMDVEPSGILTPKQQWKQSMIEDDERRHREYDDYLKNKGNGEIGQINQVSTSQPPWKN